LVEVCCAAGAGLARLWLKVSFAGLSLRGPGSRLIIIGVLLLAMSVAVLAWSGASVWLHQVQQPAGPAAEVLPERFNPVTP